jgi:hypothetical protein
MLCANVGGVFGINITATAGASGDPAVATFGPGDAAGNVQGQPFGLPTIAVSANAGAVSGATAASTVNVQATNTVGGQPAVVSPSQSVLATVTVLNPTTGLDAIGQPFQTTVFVAVQPVLAQAGVANEVAATSFGQWAGARLGEGFSLNQPPAFSRGDTNCDGNIDFFDIHPFLLALFDLPTYVTTYCSGATLTVDVDASGGVDFFDIDPFLVCLFNGCP